jgi:hypothetical protein
MTAVGLLPDPDQVQPLYLVWSNEHRGWWGPGRRGYVREVSRAGRYSYKQAIEICRNALGTALHMGMLAELPVRLDDVHAFLEGTFVPAGVI